MRLPHLATAVAAVAATLGAVVTPAQAALASAAPPAAVVAVAAPSVSRIAGADRYATSAAASLSAFPTGTRPDVVYLVSGVSPWESLSATPAAVARNGAVLLTRPDGIPASIATELKRLTPAEIVVVGSTTTVSGTVLTQAKAYAPSVTRTAGTTRYQTAEALVRQAFPTAAHDHVWVATGRSWADGLVAGAAAAALREPLLTVDGAGASLTSQTVALLRDLGATSVTIAGTTSAVSAGIQAQLTQLLGAGNVARATGTDRYSVATRVNAMAFPALSAGSAYLADGRSFVHGLAGGFLAGTKMRPMYLTQPYCVPASVRPPLAGPATTRVVLLGGEGSLRSLVGAIEPCRSITTASSTWVLANKANPLRPRTYVPANLVVPKVTYPNGQRLRSDAATALVRMFAAARSEGAGRMAIASGYRSYSTQYSVYWHRVSTSGRTYADRWIARPGYSEHQSGLGLDIAPVGNASCSAHNCIGSTPQGAWLRRNAWRFGYVLRYESGYTSVTGYSSEPWHFRYVGVPLSSAYHRGSWHTFEQFLGEPAAPTY